MRRSSSPNSVLRLCMELLVWPGVILNVAPSLLVIMSLFIISAEYQLNESL